MLKSEFGKIFLLSFFIVAVVFALVFFIFTKNFKPIYIHEQLLTKNAEFSIKPGSLLTYESKYKNESEIIVFTFYNANCTLTKIKGTNFSTCIGLDGRDEEGNISLSLPFFFFAPWMLALSENFSWNAQIYNSMNNEQIGSFSAIVLNMSELKGRRAYVIEINNTNIWGHINKRVWIDEEKRIILREEGANYTIELIQTWIPLQPQVE